MPIMEKQERRKPAVCVRAHCTQLDHCCGLIGYMKGLFMYRETKKCMHKQAQDHTQTHIHTRSTSQ